MNNIDSGVVKQIAVVLESKKNVIVNDLYLQWVLQPSYETIAVCGFDSQLYFCWLWSFIIFSGRYNKIQSMKNQGSGSNKKQMNNPIFREAFF